MQSEPLIHDAIRWKDLELINLKQSLALFGLTEGEKRKRPDQYFELKSTVEFLKELSSQLDVSTHELWQSVIDGPNESRGVFAHPLVVLHYGQWVSPRVAVFCTQIVFTALRRASHESRFSHPQRFTIF